MEDEEGEDKEEQEEEEVWDLSLQRSAGGRSA